MKIEYFKIMFLAVISDGEIHQAETDMLKNLKGLHPLIKDITDQSVTDALQEINDKINAGMKTKFLIEEIGDKLSEDQKQTAFALAKEVCAADFKVVPAETEFLDLIESVWAINEETINAIDLSIRLRYFV